MTDFPPEMSFSSIRSSRCLSLRDFFLSAISNGPGETRGACLGLERLKNLFPVPRQASWVSGWASLCVSFCSRCSFAAWVPTRALARGSFYNVWVCCGSSHGAPLFPRLLLFFCTPPTHATQQQVRFRYTQEALNHRERGEDLLARETEACGASGLEKELWSEDNGLGARSPVGCVFFLGTTAPHQPPGNGALVSAHRRGGCEISCECVRQAVIWCVWVCWVSSCLLDR